CTLLQEEEFGLGIDEAQDEPGGGASVDADIGFGRVKSSTGATDYCQGDKTSWEKPHESHTKQGLPSNFSK
ncbi:MAG: hypothetical protein L0Z50_14350, partial [Verrucomicrobiales bacterium]|nr:hypothetical protein [Verrucomicrobiales bacterium]